MGGAKRLRSQLFRASDDGNRMTKVIHRFHGIDVKPDTLLSQQLYQLGISPSAFMTRHIKRNNAHFSKALKRLVDWRVGLFRFFYFSSLPWG
jgi:hypothetical protein